MKKTLTIGDSYEPSGIVETFSPARKTTGNNVTPMLHDDFSYAPQLAAREPLLAAELPSFEKGTWRLNADGTMDTTWRLRPNIKWHDGQPFTSADAVFTFKASQDKDIVAGGAGSGYLARIAAMESLTAIDDLTFVIHYKMPFLDADIAANVDLPLPRHLLEPMYLADKQGLTTTSLLAEEFVGLGPYRMAKWARGEHFEVTRFDDYYLGRPLLDTIVVKFITDPNTLVANILAGAVDVVVTSTGSGISLDQAMEVRRRWEGTGNQVIVSGSGTKLWAEVEYRPQFARPADTLTNVLVRRALLHGLARQELNEVMTQGLSPLTDAYFHPSDPLYAEMEPFTVRYPYDPNRALQLLGEAGWQRSADGTMARQSDGQRLELDYWVRAGSNEKTAAIVADGWKVIGAATMPYVIPVPAPATDREYESTRPGFLCCVQWAANNLYNGKLSTSQINSAETRWVGANYGGYSNPQYDNIIDQLKNTMDPRARAPLDQQMVRLYTTEVAALPLYWSVAPMLLVQGVKAGRPDAFSPATATFNIFEWDRH